ncbi:hypothetical protein PC121_g20304 [Phytophthora cactorum]|nr:hypothetical protein PC121_g20304 [Phytophthora cactorum]KAG4044284.1 hypothetical protein PC123_g20271 [Phytophthora cactorum]
MYQSEPMLDDLQTWGCLAHVRIRSESRQKKEKLEARTRLLLLLGYSKSTLGYQFIDLVTAPVVTARCGNLKFHEEFTTDGTYMTHLLENALFDGDHVPPETVPVARIKTSMETCLPARSDGIFRAEKPLEKLYHVRVGPATEGSVKTAGVAAPAALQEPAEYPKGAAKARKRKRRRAKKKPATVEKETSGFEHQLKVAGALFSPCGITSHSQSIPLGVLTAVRAMSLSRIKI